MMLKSIQRLERYAVGQVYLFTEFIYHIIWYRGIDNTKKWYAENESDADLKLFLTPDILMPLIGLLDYAIRWICRPLFFRETESHLLCSIVATAAAAAVASSCTANANILIPASAVATAAYLLIQLINIVLTFTCIPSVVCSIDSVIISFPASLLWWHKFGGGSSSDDDDITFRYRTNPLTSLAAP